jgi:hypothetical protein
METYVVIDSSSNNPENLEQVFLTHSGQFLYVPY